MCTYIIFLLLSVHGQVGIVCVARFTFYTIIKLLRVRYLLTISNNNNTYDK